MPDQTEVEKEETAIKHAAEIIEVRRESMRFWAAVVLPIIVAIFAGVWLLATLWGSIETRVTALEQERVDDRKAFTDALTRQSDTNDKLSQLIWDLKIQIASWQAQQKQQWGHK